MKYVYKLIAQKDSFDQFDIFLIEKDIECAKCVKDDVILENKKEYHNDLKELINKNYNNLNIEGKKVFSFNGELFDIKEICKAANETYERMQELKKSGEYLEGKPFKVEEEKIGFLARFRIGKTIYKVLNSDNKEVYECENYTDCVKVAAFLNKIWMGG